MKSEIRVRVPSGIYCNITFDLYTTNRKTMMRLLEQPQHRGRGHRRDVDFKFAERKREHDFFEDDRGRADHDARGPDLRERGRPWTAWTRARQTFLHGFTRVTRPRRISSTNKKMVGKLEIGVCSKTIDAVVDDFLKDNGLNTTFIPDFVEKKLYKGQQSARYRARRIPRSPRRVHHEAFAAAREN